MLYEILKALHIVAVIAWMAGLLYLPRLFVYHADAEKGSKQSETFKVMERRLLRGIMNPAVILVWIFGLALAWRGDWWPWSTTSTAAGARSSRRTRTQGLQRIIAGGTKCRRC